MTEHLDDSTQQFAPLFGANNAVSGTVADSVDVLHQIPFRAMR